VSRTTTADPCAGTQAATLAEVTRRDVHTGAQLAESSHAGHLVVCGPGGRVVATLGEENRPTFVRSSVKPFQAVACLEVLAAAGAGSGQPSHQEVAVAWSSHRGEAAQLAAVRELLARSSTPETALTCPRAVAEADPGAAPTRLQHNCSGKHALFALAGSVLGVRGPELLAPEGPLQQRVLTVLAEMLGPAVAIGTDGCGAPAVAVPLRALASGYQRLLTDPRCADVRAAGQAHPLLVGGHGRLESALNAAGVVAKVGAEGLYAAAWTDGRGQPWSVAVKAEDGAVRGVAAAVIALLQGLEVVPPGTWEPPPPLGGGRPVGEVRVTAAVSGILTVVADAGWSGPRG